MLRTYIYWSPTVSMYMFMCRHVLAIIGNLPKRKLGRSKSITDRPMGDGVGAKGYGSSKIHRLFIGIKLLR